MNYSKLQKFLSSLIIFTLLFSTTFRIPFLQFSAFASSRDFFNIVALVVEEEIYSDVKDEVVRYSKDIQEVLENTRVVILPTSNKTEAFNISSMLESLYFDWYKGLDNVNFESQLIWAVFVWNFNLPEVYIWENVSKTIVPYTDFVDKKYIYNNSNKRFEENSKNIDWIKSEIWHWFISPNLWTQNDNIKAIIDYFNKNHDYYTWTWNFKFSDWILNWNKLTWVKSDYEPYVFYFDNIRENKSLNYDSYKSYLSYLNNKEDIVYDRFTKELAKEISDEILSWQTDSIANLIKKVDPNYTIQSWLNSPDVSLTPDILTRNIIEKTTKKFIQAFSDWTIWEFRSDVHNAWRYNWTWSQVNADFVPYLITVLDLVNDEIVKKANTLLEDRIDEIVKTSLQRDIFIPSLINRWNYNNVSVSSWFSFWNWTRTDIENILYWTQVKNINSAEQCSIFRWSTYSSWKLVEANRWYDYTLIEWDVNKLRNESISCLNWIQDKSSLRWYWWFNSPLNTDFSWWIPTLLSHNYLKSITPIFDINWTIDVSNKVWAYPEKPVLNEASSYRDCENSNFFITYEEDYDNEWNPRLIYRLPINWQTRYNWTCRTDSPTISYNKTYEQLLLETRTWEEESWETTITHTEPKCNWAICIDWNYLIQFKQIPSYIAHKSPTFEEIDSQMKNMLSSALPVDKDRYIDFKSNTWYTKINYPYLFRLWVNNWQELTVWNIKNSLKNYLDTFDLTIWSSLFNYLTNQTNTIWNKWTYVDNVSFAIYWNNLPVASKYKFIFENYLSDQFWWNNYDYSLIKNRNQYEIAYLWAKWDASNMYILLDPEAKNQNPYSDIIAKNQSLRSSLIWSNTNSTLEKNYKEWTFKCAPPEWVPLWQWFPAIMCRLWNMLPPTISINTDSCSASSSLLSIDDLRELKENGWDKDKNWIIDCIEAKLAWWTLKLSSDSSKYFYSTLWTLKSEIKDKNWNLVTLDSLTNINFKLEKVYIKNDSSKELSLSNRKLIYDSLAEEWSYLNNDKSRSEIKKYIDFKDWKVKASYWVAQKSFVVKNIDADFVFNSSYEVENFNKQVEYFKSSNDLIVQVRWDRLFTNTYKIYNDSNNNRKIELGTNSVVASNKDNVYISNINNFQENSIVWVDFNSNAKEKLILNLLNFDSAWNKVSLEYPIEISIFESWDAKAISTKKINNLNWFISLWSFEKSWNYDFIIKDNFWFSIKKQIQIFPDKASNIKIDNSTNIIETWWNITTNVLSIYDSYWNIASWDFYTIELSIDWKWLKFESSDNNNLKNQSYSLYDWYKLFKLISTNSSDLNNISYIVKDWNQKELFRETKQIKTVEKIYTVIKPNFSSADVWWKEYSYEISFRDKNWNLLDNFNSRIYLNIPAIYWNSTKNYFDIVNWVSKVDFVTKNISWKEIPLEFQVEWISEIFKRNLEINPEKAIIMDLSLSSENIEADSASFSNLRVELKDRFWNLVFNDNSTVASLEILDKYKNTIFTNNYSTNFKDWVAYFKINATDNPWIAYYKVKTNPSLANNYFEIDWNDWTLKIYWEWEAVWQLQTSYFWNKDKINGKKYNALYTTLLWANYWDITQNNYLAWSLLFDKENRSLWVTSLINNPYKTNDVINIYPNWNIKNIYTESDLIQDIEYYVSSLDDKIILNVYNKSINSYVWNIYYNFWNNSDIKVCNNWVESCNLNKEKTSIFIQNFSSNYKAEISWNELIYLDNFNNKLFSIDSSWKIQKFKNIELSLNQSNNNNNYLLLSVSYAWEKIWNLWFNFTKNLINISRENDIFKTKINTLKDSILVLINSNLYLSKNSLNNKIIYYNDPFASNNQMSDFVWTNIDSYENFINKSWLGWSWANKTLLEFSAWKSIWNSTKDYMSFWLINLWDPVISLKKIKKDLPKTNIKRKFDSTIWKLISNDTDLESYEVFDYNNDSKDDILIIKRNWYLELLENKDIDWNFLSKWNLANITDFWSYDLVLTWDFTWDKYDDIFFVNNKWEANILNNNAKDFYRINLNDQFNLSWKIIMSKVFDMDKDLKDDIVTLDDNWTINIFYWWWTSTNPIFTKKQISDRYWLLLWNQVRNDNWLIYFNWLYQLKATGDNSELITNSKNNLNNQNSTNSTYEVIDNIVFENLSYSPNKTNKEYSLNDFNNINKLSEADLISNNYQNKQEFTTFIKSEYSESSWIKVEKIFKDLNWWYLKSDDLIEVNIEITNTLNKVVNNFAYAERLNDIFTIDHESIQVSKDYNLSFDIASTTFLIDSFSLFPWETLKLKYLSKTKQIEYWYLKVWLFENEELWDDIYWDIILSKDNKNCSDAVSIFRSTSAREYEEWSKTPSCDSDAIKLPSSIEKNSLDNDNNWVPDYIDMLSNPNNINELKDYSEYHLNEFNNSSEYNNWNTLDAQINSALETADNIIDSISCWFWAWSCISTPLNWAPLAPGWDPTMFWKPIWDWLKVWEWLPIFSALNWIWVWPVCLPVAVWPPSPLWPWCWATLWAWGWLWVNNPTNFIRIFVTPTLTWWIWTAICFGWPASVVWISVPKWVSPITPGWNCIVLAKPLATCSDDWSDWNVWSTGFSNVNSSSYELINWNCDSKKSTTYKKLDQSFIKDYYDYRNTWTKSQNLDTNLKWIYSEISRWEQRVNNDPLISLWTNWEWWEVNVWLNFEWITSWNFSDVIQIKKSRNFDFPQFLMEWVTRQIEEIANKLTDFPTVFIILPDFSWIFDWNWWKLSWNESKVWDWLLSINVSEKVWWWEKAKKVESWIKDAYTFLSNVPLVKFEKEVVNINFPWIDRETVDRTWTDRWYTLKQRQKELWEFTDSATFSYTCNQTWQIEKENCIKQNEINSKISLDASALISSLERNIATLEDYKKMPEKIYNWLNVKERYLEQILCNVESISELMWWRISKNWQRFKAWVNLYILIKAVLKSWQWLIDIFSDYESECHECKNERMDLMTYIWWLIDMIIPKIPVIQFPKWPDIIIDLHNIRAWLTINLPEINVNKRPILLPYLPELKLPQVPNLSVSLPELPLLPTIEIPEMPDLPSLPTVELPDLPPPPTLPSLLTSIDAILNIIKLITKLMCILKKSPFVPEWRAWDQIAFLTERQWYMDLDFLFGISMPQFSFPFVDAIKVTTYVNLEFEMDFIVELAKQTAIPINNFTNNVVSLLNFNIEDIDLTNYTPSDINIDIEANWEIQWFIQKDKIIDNKELLAFVLVKNFKKLFNFVNDNKDKQISLEEFQKQITKNIYSEAFIKDPKTKSIRDIWDKVNSYSYSQENKLINDLKEQNNSKFELVKDVLNTEIIKNKNLIKNLDKDLSKESLIKVSYNDEKTNIDFYNEKLNQHNEKLIDATKNLLNSKESLSSKNELKEIWKDIVNKVKWWLNSYKNSNDNKLLAFTESLNSNNQTINSCQSQAKSNYKYTYKWLYVIENNISYRLFDYIDELDWNEKTKIIDFDQDTDEDLLYMANWELFLKENLELKDSKIYVETNPIELKSNNNKFLNWSIFYETVNNFESILAENNYINLSFSSSNKTQINNYRVELYSIVDKFLNIDFAWYAPNNIFNSIIDSFSSIDNSTVYKEENDNFIFRKNLWYINALWNLIWIRLKTFDFKNIKDDIINNNIVTLTTYTIVYAWKESVTINYVDDNENINSQTKSIKIDKYSNIEIKKPIKVISINGDAYINTNNIINIDDTNILKYIWLPLIPWTKIINNNIWYNWIHPRYIEIMYYDWSELNINFSKTSDYELYDLWVKTDENFIRLNRENDYLYAKIKSFKNNIFSTNSNQIVLSPQIEADRYAPDLNFNNSIKIPVYQKQTIDLTPYIYEDSWIQNIKDVFIDFDLSFDNNWDWNSKNDRDTNKINIIKNYNSIKVEFWEFQKLISKKIWIWISDNNWNFTFKEVNFMVYPPVPNISSYSSWNIVWAISENLHKEPINIYRYRSWKLTKLANNDWNSYVNTSSWNFNFISLGDSKWLNVYDNNTIIANINENTWKIELKNINSKIKILSSNDKLNTTIYPKIILINNEKEVYYQNIQFPSNNNITLVDDFSQLNENWIYIKFEDKSSYNYYIIPKTAPYSPWTLVIYRNSDVEKQALFTIFKDWRVNTTNQNYTLEYFEYNSNIWYKLIDKHFNKEIAKVLLKIDWEFVTK